MKTKNDKNRILSIDPGPCGYFGSKSANRDVFFFLSLSYAHCLFVSSFQIIQQELKQCQSVHPSVISLKWFIFLKSHCPTLDCILVSQIRVMCLTAMGPKGTPSQEDNFIPLIYSGNQGNTKLSQTFSQPRVMSQGSVQQRPTTLESLVATLGNDTYTGEKLRESGVRLDVIIGRSEVSGKGGLGVAKISKNFKKQEELGLS